MKQRSSIVGGMIMIAAGLLFLALQMFPGLAALIDISSQWPLIIIAVGVFFMAGAVGGTPPLAIPGSIIGGVGAILYYQNLTGNWESWSYIWSLIPGFVGIGLIIAGVLGRDSQMIRSGRRLMVISLALFVLFAFFFTGLGSLGQFWPLLLILAGLWLLVQNRRAVGK